MKLVDHEAWDAHAGHASARALAGEAVALPPVALPAHYARCALRQAPTAIHVPVPRSLDQVERVLLEIGAALGPQAALAVDAGLREAPDEVPAILGALDAHLQDRPLIIDDWPALGELGPDRELSFALRDRAVLLRDWLGQRPGLHLGRSGPQGASALPTAAPVQLMNGEVIDTEALWSAHGGDAGGYLLALSLRALSPEDHEPASADTLRARILDALPEDAAALVRALALHGRPLAVGLLEPSAARIVEGAPGLGVRVGGDLVLEPGWGDFVRRTASQARLIRLHETLAGLFRRDVQIDDPTAARHGLSILETHRHLVAAGDMDGARCYWRYGAALLIEAARSRSLDGDYRAAAALYGAVVQAQAEDRLRLPVRLRGYARHYLHFNRAHGSLEGFGETAQGYEAALQDWRENALFWSRLTRVRCLMGQSGAADETLAQAHRAVPDHPEKQAVLVARTVRGLLVKGQHPGHHRLLLDAIRIWGAYAPRGMRARDVEAQLADVLNRGWTADRLILADDAPLCFHRPTQIRISRRNDQRWLAEFPGLDALLMATGESPVAALEALISETRRTVRELMRAHTADLSPQRRMHKRLLLGRIDVIASRLSDRLPTHAWYLGTLRRDEDGIWLHTYGATALQFEVPEELVEVVDQQYYLAKVKADANGVPTGPVEVLEVACGLSDDALWDAWQARVADGG